MNIVLTTNQYNTEYVYFLEPIRNNIINNGNFIRIVYSNSIVSLNGIYIYINLNYTNIEKYYNKFKCVFDINIPVHQTFIEEIKLIEYELLKKYNSNKKQQYKIYEQFKSGNIKVFTNNVDQISTNFLLKIAGIWETEQEYGVTYKFINL